MNRLQKVAPGRDFAGEGVIELVQGLHFRSLSIKFKIGTKPHQLLCIQARSHIQLGGIIEYCPEDQILKKSKKKPHLY